MDLEKKQGCFSLNKSDHVEILPCQQVSRNTTNIKCMKRKGLALKMLGRRLYEKKTSA